MSTITSESTTQTPPQQPAVKAVVPQQTSPLSMLGSILKGVGKLWVIVTAVIGSLLVFSIIGLILAFSNAEQPEIGPQPLSEKVIKKGEAAKVAVLRLDGPISESDGGSGFSGSAQSISSTRVIKIIDQLAEDNEVKAVVLRINSPGGAVVASDEVYRRVVALQKKKIVVASLGDIAASGGYYIAVGANKIVSNPSSLTGSIGVIAQFPKLSGLYDKLGVEMRTFKSGQFKDIGSEARDVTEEEQQILESIIMGSYDQFVKAVSEGRKLDETKVRAAADGRIYTGVQAKELGLVDELGDFETAITTATSLAQLDNPTIVEYSDQSFFEALLSSKLQQFSIGADLRHIFSDKFGVYYLWTP
jgi:protease IV